MRPSETFSTGTFRKQPGDRTTAIIFLLAANSCLTSVHAQDVLPRPEQPFQGKIGLPWELYHVDEDFSQSNDIANENPEKLDEMVKLFFAEASKYNVLPWTTAKQNGLMSKTVPA